jgi:hypothetical protein
MRVLEGKKGKESRGKENGTPSPCLDVFKIK